MTSTIPMPRRRWLTRAALPLLLVGGAVAVLAYAARDAFTPAIDVIVAPVVILSGGDGADASGSSEQGVDLVVAQAPGWVEPSPYAMQVTALEGGIVQEVLVLEGERVEPGQEVARLIDDDARLELARRDAERIEADAMAAREVAAVAVAEARLAEVRDELARKRPLVDAGGFSTAELARLDLRLAAMEREVDLARAGVDAAHARTRVLDAERAIAALALDRTRVRAQAGGIVLSGVVAPGTRLEDDRTILRLYDPAHLQVRADVPLADAAKVRPGMKVEIKSEADPAAMWTGIVARGVQEADLQRNTIQFKVTFEDPTGLLRPEMLVRARFMGHADEPGESTGAGGDRIVIPTSSIIAREGARATVFIVDLAGRSGSIASTREIELGAENAGGLTNVRSGLRAGDRVIAKPPAGLGHGDRVRITGEERGE